MPQGEVVIDPFTGQSMSRDALDELLAPYRRRQGLAGEFEAPLGAVPAGGAAARDDRPHAAQPEGDPPQRARTGRACWRCCERLVILLPEAWEERRDRGLRCTPQLGAASTPPIADLAGYLEQRAATPATGCAIGERARRAAATATPSRLH